MGADQLKEIGRGHRKERLFEGGEVEWAKRRKVDAVVGLAESCDTARKSTASRVCDRRTSRVLFGDDHGDLVDLKK